MRKKGWKGFLGLAVFLLTLALGSFTAYAETGSTGYPKIIQAPGYEYEHYFTLENAKEWEESKQEEQKKHFNSDIMIIEPDGFYELDGHVVYLYRSKIVKMEIIDGNFMDENGFVQPYNEETKAAIDAHINAALEQSLAEAAAQYGVNFSFRQDYDACSNYHFVNNIMSCFKEYPAGCVQIISQASKAKTGQNLKFRQKFAQNELIVMDGRVLASYTSENNLIQSLSDTRLVAHEMGHSIEAVLNSFSNGALRDTFLQLNGGASYSKYYYYGDNYEMRYNVPACFVSDYAATSYSEDFADTFAEALNYNNADVERYGQEGIWSNEVCQKIMYVKQLFNQYAGAEILN